MILRAILKQESEGLEIGQTYEVTFGSEMFYVYDLETGKELDSNYSFLDAEAIFDEWWFIQEPFEFEREHK